MSLYMLLLQHCLNGPHDIWDTDTVWAAAAPKVPLCVTMVDAADRKRL